MNIDFNHKMVFITGGRGGIGREICKRFTESGAKVIAPESNKLDLSSSLSIQKYLDKESDVIPDIVIHCAGINELAGIEEVNIENMERVFQINFFSFVSLLHAFVPEMKKRNWGRIIAISSLYGIISRERRIPYSSSKHAMNGLVKSLALEVAPQNVLINAVAPGYVMTDMTRKNLSNSEIDEITHKIPTGRFQTGEEIANLCCFLCSDCNQSITGQIIPVDGGYTCK